jgi:hypothetical protein
MDRIKPTTLFYPSSAPTRRKRRQLPWAAMAAILSAALSIWMITQVYILHKRRYEKKLEDMVAPSREARPSARARMNEAPKLTLATPGIHTKGTSARASTP